MLFLGIGDFSLVPYDCDINNNASRIIFSVASAFCIFFTFFIVNYLLKRLRKVIEEGNLSKLLEAKTLFSFFYFLSVGLGLSVIAVAKAVDGSGYIIGQSVLTTLAFCLFAAFGWFGEIVYLRMCFKLLEGFERFMDKDAYKSMQNHSERFRKYLPYFVPPIAVSCVLPMVILAFQNAATYYIVYAMNMIYAILFGFYVYFILFNIAMIRIEMKKSLELIKQTQSNLNDTRIHEDKSILRIYRVFGILGLAYIVCVMPFVVVFPVLTFWKFWGKFNYLYD